MKYFQLNGLANLPYLDTNKKRVLNISIVAGWKEFIILLEKHYPQSMKSIPLSKDLTKLKLKTTFLFNTPFTASGRCAGFTLRFSLSFKTNG